MSGSQAGTAVPTAGRPSPCPPGSGQARPTSAVPDLRARGSEPTAGQVSSAGAAAPREGAVAPYPVVVGVGAARGVRAEEVLELVGSVLREAGLSGDAVAELATVDVRADEPGLVGAAQRLGVPVVAFSAEELAGVEVPHPSRAAADAVGTPSVAEAAALLRGGELLVPKRKSAARPAKATCAVVRCPAYPAADPVGHPAAYPEENP